MLMVYAPGANTKCRTHPDSSTLQEASLSNITHINSSSGISFSPSLNTRAPCNYVLHSSSISWKGRFLSHTHHVSQLVASKKWLVSRLASFLVKVLIFTEFKFCVTALSLLNFWILQCQLHDSIPSDDEYRSSRNIAISLFRRYRNAVDRGGGDNLKVYPLVCLTFAV